MGDPARNAMLETVIDTIEHDKLLERTQSAGKVLMNGLVNLEVIFFIFTSIFLFIF